MTDVLEARTNSGIVAAYRERTPESARLAAEARHLFPSGIVHDARHMDPYGIYVQRAQGPYKWDVDGNRYIDYFGGHGALILGHQHPLVTAAIVEAQAEGTHFGACHPREVQWARAIQALVPSAERVRFHSSGTEATLMALRLARAFTGKQTVLRFAGHFHGWHDHMTHGYSNHFDGTATVGVLPGVAEKAILLPPGDIEAVEAVLARNDDIAAVILEPTGASFGKVPLRPEFIRALRRATERAGVLLIFDEVVTGFRVSKGGAQVAFDVRPDLSSFAKIVAGGLPGAAVAGRKDILDRLDFAETAARGQEKISHPGTYNGNPVSAAAGTAALTEIFENDPTPIASARAASLRETLNEVFAQERVAWAAYGTYSGFHLYLHASGREFDPYAVGMERLKASPGALGNKLRLALLVHGVDISGSLSGFISVTHGEQDIADTAEAFRGAIRMMRAEGEVGPS